MPEVEVTIKIVKTVATFNGVVMQSILDWVKTNIKDKLPPDASMTDSYNVRT